MGGAATAGGFKQSTGRGGLALLRQEIWAEIRACLPSRAQRPATPRSPSHRHGFVIPLSRASAAMRGLPMTDSAVPPLPKPVLARRLVAAFCLTLMLCLAGTAIGIRSLQRVDAATQEAIGHSLVNERLVADAYRLQAVNAARYKAFALSSEPEVGDALVADITRTRTDYLALLGQLQSRLAGPDDAERLALVVRHGAAFEAAVQELVAARDAGLTERIRNVYTQRFEPAMQALMASLTELAALQRQAIDATGAWTLPRAAAPHARPCWPSAARPCCSAPCSHGGWCAASRGRSARPG